MLESLFNKVAVDSKTGVNIANFLRTSILKKICKRLLLSSDYLSGNTSKCLFQSNLGKNFIYTICFKDLTTFNHFNCLIFLKDTKIQ